MLLRQTAIYLLVFTMGNLPQTHGFSSLLGQAPTTETAGGYTLMYKDSHLTTVFQEKNVVVGEFYSQEEVMVILDWNEKTDVREVIFVSKASPDLEKKYTVFVIEGDLFRELSRYFDVMHWWHDKK